MFGDLSVAGIGKDLKEALNEQTQNLENLMGSQYSLNKVRIYLLRESHKHKYSEREGIQLNAMLYYASL